MCSLSLVLTFSTVLYSLEDGCLAETGRDLCNEYTVIVKILTKFN